LFVLLSRNAPSKTVQNKDFFFDLKPKTDQAPNNRKIQHRRRQPRSESNHPIIEPSKSLPQSNKPIKNPIIPFVFLIFELQNLKAT
jgi:hypothetical protein